MFTSILLFVIVWSDRPVESSSKENCELLSVVVTDVSTTFTRSCTFYMKYFPGYSDLIFISALLLGADTLGRLYPLLKTGGGCCYQKNR